MVSVLVKSFGGAPPALVFPRHRRVPGREVAQQGPGTTVQSASLQRAVQVLALIEGVVHASINRSSMLLARWPPGGGRQLTAVLFATQVQDFSRTIPVRCPAAHWERAQALCKTPAVGA